MRVLSKGSKEILLGDEAVVRGALESGVGFVSAFPGTPASEIGDTFSEIAKKAGVYFEYSTNEKVALEAAGGAALSGVNSMVAFKHFGLNVASDSLMPLAYVGAPIVIAFSDDPNCFSSAQSEQDSRNYARLAHIPTLEPTDSQECKDFTKLAFEISKKYQIPVFLRLTTRICHEMGIVKLGKVKKGKTKGFFKKDLKRYDNLPPNTVRMHSEILDKMEKIRELSEKTKVNYIINNKKSDIGVIVTGSSFNYIMESLIDLNIKIPVLKLGLSYPLPKNKIKNFIKHFKRVLVLEELDPLLESSVREIAKDTNPKLEIFGKNVLPKAGEYKEEFVIMALAKLMGLKPKINEYTHLKEYKKLDIPKRFPQLCIGCPYRYLFTTVKEVAPDAIYAGDIGCYILGIYPPYQTQDFNFSMGASEGIAHGIKKVSNQKVIGFLGDATFFHAGIPALINLVYNRSNPLIIILDNRITAMTGHQPNAGMGLTGMGDKVEEVSIEKIVKACGVKHVKIVDPHNMDEMKQTIKKFLNNKEVSVIIAKRICWLLEQRMKK